MSPKNQSPKKRQSTGKSPSKPAKSPKKSLKLSKFEITSDLEDELDAEDMENFVHEEEDTFNDGNDDDDDSSDSDTGEEDPNFDPYAQPDLSASDLEDMLDDEDLSSSDDDEGHGRKAKKNAKAEPGLSRQEIARLRGKFDVDAERTIFVGNLPVDVKEKEIRTLFAEFGAIDTVRFRSAVGHKEGLPKRVAVIKRDEFHPEVDRINCFVKFTEKESAEKALSMNNFLFRDRHLRVDACQQRGGKHGAATSVVEHAHEFCIFVGNLPFACHEETLRAHFADLTGKPNVVKSETENDQNTDVKEEEVERKESAVNDGIVNVRIIRDRYSGLGKGFGYIQFAKKESVKQAIETKNGSKFEGRKLRVTESTPQPEKTEKHMKSKPDKKDGKKKMQQKLTKEQKAEKEMLRRKWFFKAGESTSAGKSSEEISKKVKGEHKSPKGNHQKASQDHKGPKRPFNANKKQRKFKPTNAK